MQALVFVVVACLVGPSLQCGGGGGGDNGQAMAAAQSEARLQELRLWCYDHCAGNWSPWSGCSKPCAGGIQTRSRQVVPNSYCTPEHLRTSFTCSLPLLETKLCNEACPYGVPVNGECKCPLGRAGTCCEAEITCSFPGRPENSDVTGVNWPGRVGAIAQYSCRQGFSHTDGNTTRRCQANGNVGVWTGVNIKCDPITCELPTITENVRILNPKSEGYAFGEHVVFDCEAGYEREGPESRECRSTGLTSFTPRCDPLQCPDPGLPINGNREGMDLSFGEDVEFSCDDGFKLVGSVTMTCTAAKTWFGHNPTCEEISCEAPYVPLHGTVRVRQGAPTEDYTGDKAIFSCEEGYVLLGEGTMKCATDGYWDGTEPECKAIDCGDPGSPENGYKDGSIFTFGWFVTFNCFPGHTLEGRDKIQCLPNGQWSAAKPTCEPCPVNTYAGTNNDCITCPANTHTLSVGAKLAQECICNEYFVAVPGGACEKVECKELPVPQFGSKLNCSTLAADECHFACNDGYVIDRGTSIRVCQENGVWNGEQPVCSPCKINTYKSSERSCTACPVNSETTADAQMLDGCVCRVGYEGPAGGPCTDVDECEENEGMGPCDQACENHEGSYKCRCTIPGYDIDANDTNKCFPEDQCKNITMDEAPGNGGFVCKWWHEQNAQFCQVRCNPGYDHAVRVNPYETCGPTTGFEWSFRLALGDPIAPLPSCIESYFPDFRLEADMFYFTKDCDELTEEDKQEVYLSFKGLLTENNVCVDRRIGQPACNIDTSNMGIICGPKVSRRRRAADGTITTEVNQAMNLMLNVTALKEHLNKANSSEEVCDMLKLRPPYCTPENRLRGMGRYLRAAVEVSGRQLKRLMARPETLNRMTVTAANRQFEPKQNGVKTKMHAGCKPGHEARGSSEDACSPCDVGTFLNEETGKCELCPPGTFQYQSKQSSCVACPSGTTTLTNGSTTCFVCDDGKWGRNCEETCDCKNGVCSPFDGSCTCSSGWEGEHCDVDIPGCRASPCFPGVACYDIPAPGEGFQCDYCPSGYRGNGQTCIPVEPSRRRRDVYLLPHIEL